MNASHPPQGQRFSGLSVAGFVCAWFIGPLGIILSALALSEINRNQATLRGKGLAKWGIGLGILGTLLLILGAFIVIEDSSIRRANERSDRAYQDYQQRKGR
jgi:hypothetical protein